MKAATETLVLTGEPEYLIKKRQALKRAVQIAQNKEVRHQAKKEAQEKERQRNQQHPTVFTVKHQPTYACLSYKRVCTITHNHCQIETSRCKENHQHCNDRENRKAPSAFTVKNEIQTAKSQTRLKNAIGWMLMFSDEKRVFSKKGYINKKTLKVQHSFKFRLAFITLTLSDMQKHSDAFIKDEMLQPFLRWITKHYNALYVWKAESQLNGNIHFHITVDTFIPWRSVRAKWNKLLAKQGYCKVMQDGSNDKGDAATQIKSVLSPQKCANDIGGYMSKKDRIKTKDLNKMKEWLHDKGEWHPDFLNAQIHCKYNPEQTKQDLTWYKRVIDGRLWGCSESLSNINIFLDETFTEFEKEEKIFFRQNDDIYNLGKRINEKEKKLYRARSQQDRELMRITDQDIERKNRFMDNVFIHKHLSEMKKGGKLQQIIHEEKLKRKTNFQKFFTDN